MKKVLLTGLLIPLSMVATAAAQDVTLFGQLYTGTTDNAIYSFSSGENQAMTPVTESLATPNCGSVKTPDRFYCFSEEEGSYSSDYVVYVYDTTNNYELVTKIWSCYSIAKPGQTLAYNPVNEKIYTVYTESSYYGDDSNYLAEIDLSNRTMKRIGYDLYMGYGNQKVVAMAFNPEGVLYAISTNGKLYTIDITTGDMSSVGSTGITPAYEQSMTFSPDGQTIYWAACGDFTGALYTVNPATAETVKIKEFANDEEFVSLWVGEVEAAAGAPAAPAELNAEFVNGALTGTVSFTAPKLTCAGDPLEGDITYTVTAGGETVGEGTTQHGVATVCHVTITKAGTYELKVTLSNEAGQGESATLPEMYIGVDVPKYVENLTMTRGDEADTYIISWDTPSEGAHGGYVDPSTIKYRVRRLPSFDVISEDAVSPFTDTFVSDTPVKCQYEVTPYIDETTQGLPLTTKPEMIGTPFETPFASDFDTSAGANLWTVVDSNNDGHSWEWMYDMGYYRFYDNDNPKDDWLISPYIRLNAGYTYCLSFKVRTIATEHLEVMAGLGLTVEDMTMQIAEEETIPDTNYDWKDRSYDFSCPEAGNYHFGFHAMSTDPYNALAIYLKDVKLEQTGSSAVNEVLATDSQPDFMVEGNKVTALIATTVEVFNTDGRTVTKAVLAAGQSLALPAGMHIITSAEGLTLKAITR